MSLINKTTKYMATKTEPEIPFRPRVYWLGGTLVVGFEGEDESGPGAVSSPKVDNAPTEPENPFLIEGR